MSITTITAITKVSISIGFTLSTASKTPYSGSDVRGTTSIMTSNTTSITTITAITIVSISRPLASVTSITTITIKTALSSKGNTSWMAYIISVSISNTTIPGFG